MCSIFGAVINRTGSVKEWQKLVNCITGMATAGAQRGTDAAGLAVIWPGPKADVFKTNQSSYWLVNQKGWKDLLELPKGEWPLAIMGHTRAATHGFNTADNAHPFLFTHEDKFELIGTHNGVIRNHIMLAPTTPTHPVDSYNFFDYLRRAPSEDEIDHRLYRAAGNYALAFVFRNQFRLARNPGSPCVVATPSLPGVTLYASTEHMLGCGAAWGNMDIKERMHLKPGRLFSYSWEKAKWRSRIYEKFNQHGTSSREVTRATRASAAAAPTTPTPAVTGTVKMSSSLFDGIWTETRVDASGATQRTHTCSGCNVVVHDLERGCPQCKKGARPRAFKAKVPDVYQTSETLNSLYDEARKTTLSVKEMSDILIADVLKLQKMGGTTYCARCNCFGNDLRKSEYVKAVVCRSCEDIMHVERYADLSKSRGTNFCEECNKDTKIVKMVKRPIHKLMCAECAVKNLTESVH